LNIDQVYNMLEKDINISINNKKEENNLRENEGKNMNINKYENKIIGEIYIKENYINKDILIINTFGNCKRIYEWEAEKDDYEYENEKEIKENIEIKINGKIIDFNYCYRFKNEGKYIIEYSFKKNITKTCYMFYDCNLITNLNLSNFNTQNVNKMNSMFYGCNLLINLNLSNFNTQNVNDMNGMFYGCNSLKNLNLSNFNTQNVTDMGNMFYGCNLLINLNLSNFHTQNVNDMNGMFYECNSLTNLNLSNFHTQNVTDMGCMFYGCNSLII